MQNSFTSQVGASEQLTQQFNDQIGWLKNELNLPDDQMARVVKAFPLFLGLSAAENIKPFMQKFLDEGFSQDDIKKMIARRPNILGFSQKFSSTADFFNEMVDMPQNDFMKLVIKFPQVSGYHPDRNLRPKLDYLLGLGIPKVDLQSIVMRCPQVLGLSTDGNVKRKVEKLAELGLNPEEIAKVIRVSPQLLGRNLLLTVQEKLIWLEEDLGMSRADAMKLFRTNAVIFQVPLAYFKESKECFHTLGLSKPEISELIRNNPKILQQSASGLHAKYSFATDVLNKSKQQILGYARYFTTSLDNVILLRVGYLGSNGKDIKTITMNTVTMRSKDFLKRYRSENLITFGEKWSKLDREKRIEAIKTNKYPEGLRIAQMVHNPVG